MRQADRIIRVIIVVIFGILYFIGIITGDLNIVSFLLAIMFASISLITFCSMYITLKLNIVRNKKTTINYDF